MTRLALLLFAAQASAPLLPYPGVVVTGEFKTADGSRCTLLVWDGGAVAVSLLGTSEREAFENLRKEIQQRWEGGDRREVQAPLLRRYLDLMQPSDKRGFAPLALRKLTYQHVRVACGESVVRAGFALFAQGAGFALVASYPATGATIVLVDHLPRAKEVAQEAQAFFETYREELEKASAEEDLPRPVRNALAGLTRQRQRAERGRIRFVDFNGHYLPGCPEECPEGALKHAWSQLEPEERRAFAPLLGLLARAGGEPGSMAGAGAILLGTPAAWPEELGTNPVGGLEGELVKLTPGPLPKTFSRPSPIVARDLFGREDWQPPLLEGQLKDVIKAMRKAVR